jgi:hypothetical protein
MNRSKEELYLFYIYLIVRKLLFKLDVILVPDIRLSKINIGFVCEDKYIAVVCILLF